MKWSSRGTEPISWFDILVAVLVVIWTIAIVLLIAAVAASPKRASAGDVVNFRIARRLAAVVIRSEKVTTRYSEPVMVLSMEITAYSPTVAECDASPLVTASGKRVYVGGIAADLSVLPFGSIVIIPNYNNGDPCTVIDTGSLIRGKTLDVFMWSSEDARQWGRRRNVEVRVLYVPEGKR
jgi:3D (Asp-Asp-Asp) domain-containing protein